MAFVRLNKQHVYVMFQMLVNIYINWMLNIVK